MAVEIERKFLVRDDTWRAGAGPGVRYRQGYLTESGPASVRVRVGGARAFLNIKTATLAMHRLEFEYEVPVADAEHMLEEMCLRPLIEKTRYDVDYAGRTWEVDLFEGDNQGLVVAEVELDAPDQPFEVPPWAGDEVTHDHRYYNVCLVRHPFKQWAGT
ncbi:MAG: CYTH domain-containing protein [Gammaproteobacteria bacterium]|nr:CYTH domain-containing protein [Gammaproteobacteria bacterium]NIR32857.1 CYTH domain-containing protein [Gammaproteobacteria bacterium]NIR99404.1 CYTH domain-containing protein [Gammaproteobacteria bacterium]NIT65018.1 CYTH domain-containing protein [Gammaproteobacteria bacterium]NIV21932.1 CYTH domain-containing protein [Gammaproteobacteria bacterium]